MSDDRKAVDASTSNAGDDFHLDWAVRRSLEMLRPGTDLIAVKPEGITPVDAIAVDYSGHAILAVDLTEYYGGDQFADASLVVYSQLKYSTTAPSAPWTVADVTRGKRGGTFAGSLIRKLADAFKRHLDTFGRTPVLSKLRLQLVSNRPTQQSLLNALDAAKESLVDETVNQQAKLLTRLGTIHHAPLEALFKASGLKSSEYCDFIRILDLSSHTDELSRVRQEIEISKKLADHGFFETNWQRDKLKSRIWDLSQPHETASITRDEVVSLLSGSYRSLFPAAASITLSGRLVEREQSRTLAHEIVSAASGVICVHGGGGYGKTTLLSSVTKHLPEGSVGIMFDCFASGAYKDPEDRRHLHKYGIRQICNELAVATKTDLLLNTDLDENDLNRVFIDKLRIASKVVRTHSPEALVCVIIDAADNSVAAADEQNAKSFVHDLVRCSIPDGCRLVVSCRTHRRDTLKLDRSTVIVPIEPFSMKETEAKVSLHFDGLTQEQTAEFYALSNGIPRVQEYALSLNAVDFDAVLEFLRPTGKTLEDLFERAIAEAGLRNGSDELVGSICQAFAHLPRPVPLDCIALLAGSTRAAVEDVCADLVSGLYVVGDSANLRDENFDAFLSQKYPMTQQLAKRRAELFTNRAASSDYASRNLGLALSAAGQADRLLEIVESRVGLEIIQDPIERRRLQISRIRLALQHAVGDRPTTATIRLLFALAKESKASETTNRLLDEHPDLALQYGTPATVQRLYFTHEVDRPGSMAIRHMSCAAIFSRVEASSASVREHQRLARIQLREWLRQRSPDEDDHPFDRDDVGNEHFAMLVESYLRSDGYDAAHEWMSQWRPRDFRLDVCRRVALRCFDSRAQNPLLDVNPKERDVLLALVEACVNTCAEVPKAWIANLSKFTQSLKVTAKSRRASQLRETIITAAEAATTHRQTEDDWCRVLELYCPPAPRVFVDHSTEESITAVDLFLRSKALMASLTNQDLTVSDPSLLPSELVLTPKLDDATRSDEESARLRKEEERLARHREEHLAVYAYLLPTYLFRARAICGQLDRAEYVECLNAALNAWPSSTRHYEHRALRYRWRTHRAKILCRTVAWTSSDVAVDFDKIVGSFSDFWAELLIDFAAIAVRVPGIEMRALELIHRAFLQIQSESMAGSERVRLLIRCCEVASEVDQSAGQVYFDESLKAAEEVDDEAFSIISLLTTLGKRARADKPDQDMSSESEKLACVVEDFSYRLDGWDHFPWKDAISGITHLSSIAGAAVVCRWDQAGRLSIHKSLPTVMQTLVDLGELDSRFMLASFVLPGYKSFDLSVKAIDLIAGESTRDTRIAIREMVDFCIRKSEFGDRRQYSRQFLEWLEGRNLANSSEVAVLRHFCKFLDDIDTKEVSHSNRVPPSRAISQGGEEPPKPYFALDGRFVDKRSIERPLQQLIQQNQAGAEWNLYVERSRILAEIQSLVPITDFVEHLDALLEVSGSVVPFDDLMEALCNRLEAWNVHPAVQRWAVDSSKRIAALAAEHLFGEYGLHFHRLDKILKLLQMDRATFLTYVLSSFPHGNACEEASAKALYEFMSELVAKLEHGESQQISTSLLNELSANVRGELAALNVAQVIPQCQDHSIATWLVWYLLGHPDTRIRWRAIHGCRTMYRVGYSLLRELPLSPSNPQRHPYCNKSKAFYWLAARQWYFMLFERLATEAPESMLEYRDIALMELRASPYPHAVISNCCRRAIECLANYEPSRFSTEDLEIASECLAGRVAQNERDRHAGLDRERGTRFDFDTMDTVPYWYDPLARVFDLSADEFFPYLEKIICDEWGMTSNTDAGDCTRAMYPHEDYWVFSNRQSGTPIIERLHTHVELHAMHCAAVRMLSDHAVRVDQYSDGDENRWDSWLSRWDLSIPSFWISDLRQPTPMDELFWVSPKKDEWYRAPTDDEFEAALGIREPIHPGYLLVWGTTDLFQYRCSRDYRIQSALVSPDTAHALMRALQDSHTTDFRIPWEGDDDMEILDEFAGLRLELRGWILDRSIETSELEGTDPFAYRSSATVLRPGTEVTSFFSLEIHQTSGEFRNGQTNDLVAFRESWCDKPDRVVDERNAFLTYGHRLWFRKKDLLSFLQEKSCSLIVEVQVRRSVDEGKLDDADETRFSKGQHDWKSRLYLVDRGGGITSVNGSYRLGEAALDGARTRS